ncbi:hypothetical protein ACFFIR_16255, partial [Microbacterium arthrosphaerae]
MTAAADFQPETDAPDDAEAPANETADVEDGAGTSAPVAAEETPAADDATDATADEATDAPADDAPASEEPAAEEPAAEEPAAEEPAAEEPAAEEPA